MAREPVSALQLNLPLRLRWSSIRSLPSRIIIFFFDLVYQLVQLFIILLFKPPTPKSQQQPSVEPFGRIAVIGAGLTGVSTAAHCIAHNFDVTLYDSRTPSIFICPFTAHPRARPNRKRIRRWDLVPCKLHFGTADQLPYIPFLSRRLLARRLSEARRDPGRWVFLLSLSAERTTSGDWEWTLIDTVLLSEEIRRIWEEYKLDVRTKLKTEVVKVERVPGTGPVSKEDKSKESDKPLPRSQWLVYTSGSDQPDGPFDAVVCTIGTCGDPIRVHFDGTEEFERARGRVVHSSELDQLGTEGSDEQHNEEGKSESSGEGPDTSSTDVLTEAQPEQGISYADKVKASTESLDEDTDGGKGKDSEGPKPLNIKGKTVAIVGSGASGVEAAEWAVEKGAGKVLLLARDDKWIIPRNVVFDTILAMQPFGREMPLSFVVESFLRKFHYGGLAPAVAPQNKGLFAGTPVVNDVILDYIREGKMDYIRCSTERLTSKGVVCKYHGSDKEVEFDANIVILATGFKRPSTDFLPKDLFPPEYDRPNLYLQTFSAEDWSVLLTNAAYMNALGTVGHFHIGIYTRILLTFLLDKDARPAADDMKLWVDVLRFIKRGAPGGALGFFTYAELTIWFLAFHLFRPSRLRWIFFIMQGWGVTHEDAGRFKVE
ncbi:FAD/NAD-binding domain-containing protein [Sanghuangporus baumii]|uniref:FAD/NAD-binding domain-containing protein n=1 Tax=Sanghuangporus baumii TaxID=108892 RepID=A0A9Q5HWZ6_SANBA|nr:FAD/NAD-binding domain-containing protein [Sanghuangporus baumii]